MDIPDYFNRINDELLRLIPSGVRTVVEVGCGAGAMGARYRLANPGTRYVGIECHPQAARFAATRLDRVVVGNAESLTVAELGISPGSVDCLVYGDVLEHLIDPWGALKRHVGWLRPGGQVVACVPNVQHWSLLTRLLTGDWRYQDEGLLDRTHLRFFSLDTILELFRAAGLEVTEVCGRGHDAPECRRLQPLVQPLLGALGIDPDVYAARSAALQYLVRGTQAAALNCGGVQPQPRDPAAEWLARGDTHRGAGEWREAADCYRQALQSRPESAEIASNLGLVLHEQGKLEEARSVYERALQLGPDAAETHVRVGNLMQDLDRAEDAVASYERGVALRPDPFAHANLGQVLANQGKMGPAAEHFDASVRLRPNPKAVIVRETLLPPVYESHDDLRGWRERLVAGLERLHASGVRVDPTTEIVPALFFLAYQGQNDRDLQRAYARLFECKAEPPPERRPGGKVRVGFLSKHFCNHTIGTLNRGVVAQLSREHLHVTVLSVGVQGDQTNLAFQEHADHYVALPQHLPTARRTVADLGLDVLYYTDIGMAPFTYSLAFSRLAPVQCVTWGHPLTTGVPAVDYFVSSDLAEPDDAQDHYSERLVRLAGLQTYYARPRPDGPPRGRDYFGLPADSHLYGCPQTLFKFHPDFDAALAGILRADPKGLLVLLEGRHPHWTRLLLGRWQRVMPDVVGRVRFLPKMSRDDFLHLNALFAAALDPLHYGGGNTTYEALALGTPVVTLPAPYLRGRLTLAQYRQMGTLDCVAGSVAEYVALAVRLGTDPEFRRGVRDKILAMCSVLYENPVGVRSLEEFFLRIGRR